MRVLFIIKILLQLFNTDASYISGLIYAIVDKIMSLD